MIRAVVFDNGGVLHEANHATSDDLRSELGLSEAKVLELWGIVAPRLGSGQISEAELWDVLHDELGIRRVDVAENLLGRAFERNYQLNRAVYELVEETRAKGVQTAILSNIIEPHARVLRKLGHLELFDHVLLSHELGVRKPDPVIFRHLLTKLKLAPDEVVFIDDDPGNVAAAAALGIHGLVFTDAVKLRRELTGLMTAGS
jgi:putative hydrolase of the HAD superfamily